MQTKYPPNKIKLIVAALGLAALGISSVRADLWDYPMRKGDGSLNTVNFTENPTWATSTAKTSVTYSGTTTRPGSRIFNASSGANSTVSFSVQATEDASDPNEATWRLWWPEPMTSASASLVMKITGGTGVTIDAGMNNGGNLLSPNSAYATWVDGVPNYSWGRTNNTGFENINNDVSHCGLICYFTNAANNPHPKLTFNYQSGTIGASSRIAVDFIRFEKIVSCSTVAAVSIAYPFKAGDTSVIVQGVDPAATAVKVYTNGVLLGSNGTPSPGNTTVTLNYPLIKGRNVVATQVIGSNEGCNNVGGVYVGTFNPSVRVGLNLRNTHSSYYTGPIGAGGSVGTSYTASDWYGYFVMPNTQNGYTPPSGGTLISQNGCWQTVTIHPQTAPYGHYWFTTGTSAVGADTPVTIQPWCALDGFMFEMNDTTDVGPYQIYIANLANGSTMIHDFNNEGFYANGGPGTSTTPTPGTQSLLESVTYSSTSVGVQTPPPGSTTTACSTNASFPNQALGGTNSQFIYWCWNQPSPGNFLRLITDAPQAGWSSYPQLDMTKPISFDILMLPGGVSAANSRVGEISFMDDQVHCSGETANFSITAQGPMDPAGTLGSNLRLGRTFTWQWKKNGVDLAGQSGTVTVNPGDPPATISGSDTVASSATYSVVVSDGTCSLTRQSYVSAPAPAAWGGGMAAPVDLYQDIGDSVSIMGNVSSPCSHILSYQWYKNSSVLAGASGTDSGSGISVDIPGFAFDPTKAGDYYCVAHDTVTSLNATSQVVRVGFTAVVNSTPGDGLRGDYYNAKWNPNTNALGPYAPVLSVTNTQVNVDWTTGSPNALISTDYFMVRWTGFIQPTNTGYWALRTFSDDGSRVWVMTTNGATYDGNWVASGGSWAEVVNVWQTQNAQNFSQSTPFLLAGAKYPVILEYFENTGGAVARLQWGCSNILGSASGGLVFNPSLDQGWDFGRATFLAVPQSALFSVGPFVNPAAPTLSPNTQQNGLAPLTVAFTATSGALGSGAFSRVSVASNGVEVASHATAGAFTTNLTFSAAGTYQMTARVYFDSDWYIESPATTVDVISVAPYNITVSYDPNTGLMSVGSAAPVTAGVNYRLMMSPTLSPPNWQPLTPDVVDTDKDATLNLSATIPIGTATQMFFKVVSY